jgi:hypothetical protein
MEVSETVNTNSGDESEGLFAGCIEYKNLFILLGGLALTLVLTLSIWHNRNVAPVRCFAVGSLPFLITLLWFFGFRQGKPKAHDRDLLQTALTGKSWQQAPNQPTGRFKTNRQTRPSSRQQLRMDGFARAWSFGAASGKADIPPRALCLMCPRNRRHLLPSVIASTRQSAAFFTPLTSRPGHSCAGASTATIKTPWPLMIRPRARWEMNGRATFGQNVTTVISRQCSMASSGASA